MSFKNAVINIGLASLPVKLEPAGRDNANGFNQVHQHNDGKITKIKQQNFCSDCNSVVPFEELKKGLDVGNSKFVIVTEAELDAFKPESKKEINIDAVVLLIGVNPVFYDKSYYLIPDVKENAQSKVIYQSLFESLRNTGKAATGVMTDRGKIYNIIIRVSDNGLMLHTMFTSAEIREAPALFASRDVEANPMYVNMMTQITAMQTVPFDAKNVMSKYDADKAALIERKKLEANLGADAPPASSAPGVAADALLATLKASINRLKPEVAPEPEKKSKAKVKTATKGA